MPSRFDALTPALPDIATTARVSTLFSARCRRPFGVLVAVLWSTCFIPGCRDSRVEVHGTVTQSSQPLGDGFVAFDRIEPAGPSVRRATQLRHGRFDFEGEQALLPGVYRVTVTAGNPLGIVKQSGTAAPVSRTEGAQAGGVFVFDRISVTADRPEIVLRLEDARRPRGGP